MKGNSRNMGANTNIFRRHFVKNLAVPLGMLTLLPLLNLNAAEDRGPWISLFNGKDLTGWEGVNGTSTNWKVENGLLVSTSREQETQAGLLTNACSATLN